jgi:hypothetical protein
MRLYSSDSTHGVAITAKTKTSTSTTMVALTVAKCWNTSMVGPKVTFITATITTVKAIDFTSTVTKAIVTKEIVPVSIIIVDRFSFHTS